MKGTSLALLCLLAAPVRAQYGPEHETHRLTANLDATVPVSNHRALYYPGFYGSLEDQLRILPFLSLGVKVGHHIFYERKHYELSPLLQKNNLQVLSLAALARVNLTPPNWTWTPFIEAGWSGNRVFTQTNISLLGVNQTVRNAFWRGGFIGSAGMDWTLDSWVLGVEGGFQTLGRTLNLATGGLRIGWSFSNLEAS